MNQEKLSDTVNRKFVEQFDVSDWEIETDSGFVDIIKSNKTIEYVVYKISLENDYFIECADTHILFDENLNEIFAIDCIPEKTLIMTDIGLSKVISVTNKNRIENMYDLEVDSNDHRFYSNGILSHNTISMTAYLLWFVLFNSYKNVGLLANKKSNSTKALARLKLAYEKLPIWLQQGILSWNKGDIELENGSKITAYAAGSDAARGESFSALMADEIAFVPTNVWSEYYSSSYPTISSGKTSKIMLASTPNGMNHFYSLVQGARNETNTYKLIEVDWTMIPNRTLSWKKETIDNTSVEAFQVEHCNEFRGSTNTLVPSSTLGNLVPGKILKLTENMEVVEDPIKGHVYFITVDVAHGLGGEHDSSTISVIDVSDYPFKQVATYKNNKISTLVFPSVIESIGIRYNKAHILVETNDIGSEIVRSLNWDFEYPNLVSTKTGIEKKSKLGIRVNKKTKRIGCNRLKDMLVSEKLEVTSDATINELYAFQESGDSYAAAYGHDDLVMGLVNFAYFVSTDKFSMLINKNKFKEEFKDQYEKAVLDSLTPAPVIIDGINNNQNEILNNGYIDGAHNRGFMS